MKEEYLNEDNTRHQLIGKEKPEVSADVEEKYEDKLAKDSLPEDFDFHIAAKVLTDNIVEDITIEQVREDLQTAMNLELSTIPPYLSALYSISEGANREAVEIIRSVVVEEMLHMVMVANLLNAVGGKPQVGKFTPDYPSKLPGNVIPSLTVPLLPFSKESIRIFERIEHPEGQGQFSKSDLEVVLRSLEKNNAGNRYKGIGQFYESLKESLIKLEEDAQAKNKTIFIQDANQVTNEQYYGAGGKIITVSNIDDAKKLIDEIVGQGEGVLSSIFSDGTDKDDERLKLFGPGVDEYAHYFRFKEIRYERFYALTDSAHRDSPNKGLPTGTPFQVDWSAMHNFRPNAKLADYKPDSALYQKSLEFNQTYQALLDNINAACNGKPDELRKGVTIMYDLKYKAVELMKIPIRKEDLTDEKTFVAGQTAAPPFELAN